MRLAALTLAGATFFLGIGPAGAQPSRRPQTHRAPPNHIAPDTTASIPLKPTSKAVAAPSDEALPTPFNLPTASRSRVRECGDKWQSIKLSGQAGDRIWRDFATGCLAAKTGPFETHP